MKPVPPPKSKIATLRAGYKRKITKQNTTNTSTVPAFWNDLQDFLQETKTLLIKNDHKKTLAKLQKLLQRTDEVWEIVQKNMRQNANNEQRTSKLARTLDEVLHNVADTESKPIQNTGPDAGRSAAAVAVRGTGRPAPKKQYKYYSIVQENECDDEKFLREFHARQAEKQSYPIDTDGPHLEANKKKRFFANTRPDYLNVLVNPCNAEKMKVLRKLKKTK